MAFAPKYQRPAEAVAAIAATAAMFYFGNGLDPLWQLMWFAPLPVLWFALRSRWWAAAIASVAAMLCGNLNLWSYFTKTLGMPHLTWLGFFLIESILFAAGVLLFRALVLRGDIWIGLIALPAAWTASEYVRNLTTPHGSAGCLAYSQLKFLPFLQLASITGPWGMTFILLVFPAAIAIGLHLASSSPKRAWKIVSAGTGVVSTVLLFGVVRLASPQTHTVKVGLIASDEKAYARTTRPGPATEQLFRDYSREAKTLIAEGAQAIVMPEKLGVILEGKTTATDAMLQSLAASSGTTVVAGVLHEDANVSYNQARIYVAGSSLQRYDKEHMLPPFESNLKPGTMLAILQRPEDKWGVAICKDMDFGSPSRLYGRAGVGLMLVPAWDFVVDGAWHGHIAIMRGVEEGFSIARAAKGGFLTVSDNRGRIIGEQRSNAGSFATLLVDVPSTHSRTAYQILGDWFAWLACTLFVLAFLRLFRTSSLPT